MTREDIIRLACHADREWDCDRNMFEWVLCFAEMVARAEREEIAKMFESLETQTWHGEDFVRAIRGKNHDPR
jgi:hypothetical protein